MQLSSTPQRRMELLATGFNVFSQNQVGLLFLNQHYKQIRTRRYSPLLFLLEVQKMTKLTLK